MYHSREYDLDFFKDYIYSADFLIVTSDAKKGERSKKLLMELPTARYIDVEYNLSKEHGGGLKDTFSVSSNFEHNINGKEYSSLYAELQQFVREINNISKRIVIDISELHLRFLGAFLATLSDFEWDSIISAYAEPIAYIRTQELSPEGILDNGVRKAKGAFDLNTSFWGYSEIPNLKTVTNKRDKYIWIAFLGFEGKRAAAVYQEISDDSSITIPVITVPSIRPGWATVAFDSNQNLFENARLSCQSIEYIDALSPFAAYNLIEKIQNKYPKRHIVLSPLGTRPISLGVLLYALKHEESEVYYDTPKASKSKINNAGKVHLYDLLSFYE